MKRAKLNTQKISFRLTFKYSVFFFSTLIVMSAAVLFGIRYYLFDQAKSQIESVKQSILQEIESGEPFNRLDFGEVAEMYENVELYVLLNDDRIFDNREQYDIDIPEEAVGTAIKLSGGGKSILYATIHLVNDKEDKLNVQLIKNLDNERDFIKVLLIILTGVDTVFIFVSVFFGFFMSKRALRPIEKITKHAQEIRVGDLSKRLTISGPDDELKRLAETFNAMISSIEVGYEKQNRFTLDAAHELATPLAVINGYVDIIRRWGKDNPDVFTEAITAIKKEITNMNKLLSTLLQLAKGDNEQIKLEKVQFWLNDLMDEVVKDSRIIYENVEIGCEPNEKIEVLADQRLIKQMLRAIISNSIKYAKDTCNIEISSCQKNNKAIIKIKDNGIGIGQDALPHIFDRFYRVDKARTRDTGGAGLGLSVVKMIVERHGGEINVESTIGEYTTFIIQIPILDS